MNKIKMLIFLSVGIAFASAPFTVNAEQITPNPNPIGSTIIVNTHDAYNSLVDPFINYGDIKIGEATLSNSGKLNNIGRIGMESGSMYNNGTLNNDGGISMQYSDSGIYNTGTLNNNSMISNGAASGTISNTGTLNNNLGGVITGPDMHLWNRSGGTLNNAGLIDISDHPLLNYGSINNDGTIAVWSEAVLNYGIINNNSGGTLKNAFNVHNSSTLINNGIITYYDPFFLAMDPLYSQSAGQTINNGTITQKTINIVGGSLSGNGTITGDVTIGSGAIVSPGNSPGTLTINGTFSSNGNLVFDIGGLIAGQYDVLDINGNAYFTGGNIEFDFINGFNASAGNYWDFLFADSITGWDTLSFSIDGLGTGLGWELDFLENGGGARLLITENGGVPTVPEPATMLLLGLGLMGLAGVRRKMIK